MEFVSAKKLSEIFGIKAKTFYTWAHAGKINAYKLGRLLLFKEEEVRAWIESCKLKPFDLPDLPRHNSIDLDEVVNKAIESVLSNVYNSPKREIKPDQGSRKGR